MEPKEKFYKLMEIGSSLLIKFLQRILITKPVCREERINEPWTSVFQYFTYFCNYKF